MVDEAQEEAAEVKRKEVRDAKFQYASITFDTFKPSPASDDKPTLYQPEVDEEQMQRRRVPSFARNYNPVANRAMLARSYEVVTPMAAIAAAAAAGGGNQPSPSLGQEEYDKLVHQERKMTGSSQRNFSISTKVTKNNIKGQCLGKHH